jgi:vesicle coat complex subunit
MCWKKILEEGPTYIERKWSQKEKKRTPPTSCDSDSDYEMSSESSFEVKSRPKRKNKKLPRKSHELDEDPMRSMGWCGAKYLEKFKITALI